MATAPTMLDPHTFRLLCRDAACAVEDDLELAAQIDGLRRRIDPSINGIHPAAFATPLAVARRLYRRSSVAGREQIILAVAALDGDRFVSAVAAVLGDAAAAGDDYLLGWLCQQLDLAHRLREGATAADDHEQDEDEVDPSQVAARSLRANEDLRWERLRNQINRVVTRWMIDPRAGPWHAAMLGYFRLLPAGFLPPVELIAPPAVPVAAADLPWLKKLLQVPAQWWRAARELRELGEAGSHPFVHDLIESRLAAAQTEAEDDYEDNSDAMNAMNTMVSDSRKYEHLDLELEDLLDPLDDPETMTPPPAPPPPPMPEEEEPVEIIPLPRWARLKRFARSNLLWLLPVCILTIALLLLLLLLLFK